MSVMTWANSSWRLPMTLIGKTQGKVRRDSGCCGWVMVVICIPPRWGRDAPNSSGDGPAAADARLVFLEERVHALEDRPGLAAADGLAVERRDREHFLGRGGEPHLVGGAQLRFRHRP